VIRENLSQGHLHPSKIQKETFYRLRNLVDLHLELDFPVERYRIDIAYPYGKLGVEIDGIYWHKLKKRNNRRRNKVLKAAGWKILRIPVDGKGVTPRKFKKIKDFIFGKQKDKIQRFPRYQRFPRCISFLVCSVLY